MSFKYLIIIINLLVLQLEFDVLSKDFNHQKTVCPKSDDTDWVYVNYLFSNPRFEEQKSKFKIDERKTKLSELESKDPKGLRKALESIGKHWKALESKGITILSNENTCKKIEESISSEKLYAEYLDEFRRLYFRIDNRYLILYIPTNNKARHRKWPAQILNQNFEVISDFKM